MHFFLEYMDPMGIENKLAFRSVAFSTAESFLLLGAKECFTMLHAKGNRMSLGAR